MFQLERSSIISIKAPFSPDTAHIRQGEYQDMSAFQSFRPRHLHIDSIPSLSTLAGLSGQHNWSLSVTNCDNLADLGSTLKVKNIFLEHNPALADISGLLATNQYVFNISIRSNSSLQSLHGLQNIPRIEENLILENNNTLVDISALEFKQPYLMDSLSITNNSLLEICSIPAICSYIELDRPRTISNNASTCYDELAVLLACGIVSSQISHTSPSCFIFPNPAVQDLKVLSSNPIHSIKLYSPSGSLVLNSTSPILNVSSIDNGFYVLVVITNTGHHLEKIVISH